MLRDAVGQHLDHEPHFRWRGESVTRIENLSDIAFALALGMLISGIDAPTTYPELIRFLVFIIPAAAGFAVLLSVWSAHYTFFRRYGLTDKRVIFYNAVLIFLVLYMAYPLRFAFDSFFAFVIGVSTGDVSRNLEIGVSSFEISGRIIAIFGVIYGMLFSVISLMYVHALRQAEVLQLNAYELAMTQRACFARGFEACLAFGVAALAWFTNLNGFAGGLLFFTWVPYVWGRKIFPVQADDSQESPA
ncbi:TMEM175 family protein [Algimonas porphyrae]|uniref:DUF1211 domain-containing protein n=1 Tax=Algimonas porphyrae TaxID=1128113 RepID=A0ABQ5UYU5_9PROT|nr:TMEM175 family protein [Algimonas porphyrae]GLQ19536.1 hypothetical protein GCM10007854_04910 [Algimonas porphyrae]